MQKYMKQWVSISVFRLKQGSVRLCGRPFYSAPCGARR